MEPNQIAAFELIEQAQQAMKKGEMNTARQLAARAAQTAPELEEVWLIMAALASPRGSVAFVQRALDINPQSERAQKGMVWAQKRLQQELDKQAAATQKQAASEAPTRVPVPPAPPVAQSTATVTPSEPEKVSQEPERQVEATPEPVFTLPDNDKPVVVETPEPVAGTPTEEVTSPNVVSAVSEPKTSPRKAIPASSVPAAAQEIQSEKTATNRSYSRLAIPLVALVCLVLIAIAAFFFLNTSSAAALISGGIFAGKHGPAWAQANIVKASSGQTVSEPAVEPTATLLFTPAPELALPTIAATDIPLPTETPLPPPTNTLSPTELPATATSMPLPTATPFPTASPTATVEVAAVVEGASPTPLPTDTAMPAATPYSAPTTIASGGNSTTAGASGERWIDVDLTHQMVYAYQGNTVVNSFLVSTGTWQHPTVTGQYHVYVKYLSTTMTGPGYNLPNVPYTMYFYKGYGLHGTYWHSNFGTPMSHGCVNLSIPDSQWLYNWASVGTLVNIHY